MLGFLRHLYFRHHHLHHHDQFLFVLLFLFHFLFFPLGLLLSEESEESSQS